MGERFDAVKHAIKESWVGRTAGWISENIMPALDAAGRQGLKEVAQALPAFPDSIRPVEELGTLGNPTQLQVNMEQGVESPYQVWLKDKQSEMSAKPPENDRGMEL